MIKKGTGRPVSIRRARESPIRTIVEGPAKECYLANIQHMIPLSRVHILILPLRPEQIDSKSSNSETETDCAAPPDNWRTHQVILDLGVAPTTHPQTKMQEWPVEWLGSQDVFLIWVRNESIVRGHHRHVQMPPITKEGGFVLLDLASRHYNDINSLRSQIGLYPQRSFV